MRPMRRQPDRYVPHATIELDVLDGLEALAADEVEQLHAAGPVERPRPGALRFGWQGDLRPLLGLRCVIAASLSLTFPVPRPKALLGHQHLTLLLSSIETILQLHPQGAFTTMRLSAAGDGSTVLVRLKEELAERLGLAVADDEGDLLVRLRRASGDGWEVLVRISPRPLATRAWRVCDFQGAMNASLAHAMALLTSPRPNDMTLNLCCGSGTLLIERLLAGPVGLAIGCDISAEALDCAHANLAVAGLRGRAHLEQWDAAALPLDTASVDTILADLPFGQLVGTHAENERLYPLILGEAGRVAKGGALMVLLTHELRLLERAAAQHEDTWLVRELLRVRTGGMMPGVFVLERK
jgi:tRNA (guanine6-N2)-methyltransferase